MSSVGPVLFVGDPSDWLSAELEKLRREGFTIHVLSGKLSRKEILECLKVLAPAQYTSLVCHNSNLRPFTRDIFELLLPGLHYVSRPGAGYDDVDIEFLTEHGVYFANGPITVSHPTATTTTMLILQAVRAASQAERAVRQGRWHQGLESTPDIRNLTLGIVGLGRIGKIVQQQVEALGMNVIYYNRHRLPENEEGKASFVTFEQLLTTADVISLHTPLTSETRHMLSYIEFSKMKDGVFIVNTSRGPVIDEEALVSAMKTGKVSRVGLDVYEREPVVHPWLMQTDRASLLPHWAANTTRNQSDSEKESLANLKSWLYTGKPNTPVNSPRRS
ncbi:D-isomer specific 2-hydroxyacid dehydrogenase [Hysterangium stoloniferum]|nr:D-isomer specific 2-hydroxyacid dehydrogenase [Hysterangium stoloniferum]